MPQPQRQALVSTRSPNPGTSASQMKDSAVQDLGGVDDALGELGHKVRPLSASRPCLRPPPRKHGGSKGAAIAARACAKQGVDLGQLSQVSH